MAQAKNAARSGTPVGLVVFVIEMFDVIQGFFVESGRLSFEFYQFKGRIYDIVYVIIHEQVFTGFISDFDHPLVEFFAKIDWHML